MLGIYLQLENSFFATSFRLCSDMEGLSQDKHMRFVGASAILYSGGIIVKPHNRLLVLSFHKFGISVFNFYSG